MSISVIPISTPANMFEYNDSAMGNSADVVKASSTLIYWLQATNSTVSAIYVKLANAASATPGTTAPDVCLLVPASSTQTFVFNAGTSLPGITFGTGLTAWCVTGAAASSNTSPASNCPVTIAYV